MMADQKGKKMNKKELLKKLDECLKKKGMKAIETFSGKIGISDNKATIEDTIECLEASDAEMMDYLTVIKLAYPNIYNAIINAGDFLTHSHNRYYVYGMARMIINQAN